MGRFGFWVLCVLPSAVRPRWRSSFPPRAILPWAFTSLRCDGYGRRFRGVYERAGANDPPRSTDRPAPALPARIRSWVSRQTCWPAMRSVSNTEPIIDRCARRRPFSVLKRSMPCRSACGLSVRWRTSSLS